MRIGENRRGTWGVAMLLVAVGLAMLKSLAGAAESMARPAPEMGQPAVVVPEAVTLQIVCRGASVEGKFKPQQATVLRAEVWAGSTNSRADANGFSAQPLAQGAAAKGKKAAAKKAAAQQAKQGKAAAKSAALTVVSVFLKPEGDNATLGLETSLGDV